MLIKLCSKCLKNSEFTEKGTYCKLCTKTRDFTYRRANKYRDKSQSQKDKFNASMRKYFSTPDKKEKRRLAILNRKYKLKPNEWYEMLENQDFSCKICKSKSPGGIGQFHLDHDHLTGKIRGLLCHNCNIGLGAFKDSILSLECAINYLKES